MGGFPPDVLVWACYSHKWLSVMQTNAIVITAYYCDVLEQDSIHTVESDTLQHYIALSIPIFTVLSLPFRKGIKHGMSVHIRKVPREYY
jgi:hypothetical protein